MLKRLSPWSLLIRSILKWCSSELAFFGIPSAYIYRNTFWGKNIVSPVTPGTSQIRSILKWCSSELAFFGIPSAYIYRNTFWGKNIVSPVTPGTSQIKTGFASYILSSWNIYIMVLTTEGFSEVTIESWGEWDLNPRPLNFV